MRIDIRTIPLRYGDFTNFVRRRNERKDDRGGRQGDREKEKLG